MKKGVQVFERKTQRTSWVAKQKDLNLFLYRWVRFVRQWTISRYATMKTMKSIIGVNRWGQNIVELKRVSSRGRETNNLGKSINKK